MFETIYLFINHNVYSDTSMVWLEMVTIVVTHSIVLLTVEFNRVSRMFLSYHHTLKMNHRKVLMDFHFIDNSHHQFVLVYVDFNVILIHVYNAKIYN